MLYLNLKYKNMLFSLENISLKDHETIQTLFKSKYLLLDDAQY